MRKINIERRVKKASGKSEFQKRKFDEISVHQKVRNTKKIDPPTT